MLIVIGVTVAAVAALGLRDGLLYWSLAAAVVMIVAGAVLAVASRLDDASPDER